MNKYTKLNKKELLEICKIIHPDTNWKFHQLLDNNDGKGADDCYEFLGDDESIMQFNIHKSENGQCLFFYKGDVSAFFDDNLFDVGEEMVENAEDKINEYILNITVTQNDKKSNSNYSFTDNDIKERFIDNTKIDKFTQIEVYKSMYATLDVNELDDLAESNFFMEESKNRLPKFSLYLSFKYRKKENEDLFILQVYYSQMVRRGNKLDIVLNDCKILLIFDDKETVVVDKIIDLEKRGGDYWINEIVSFETDITLLTKIINSNNIEYRIQGQQNIYSESKLSKNDILMFKGFYNSLFDSSYKRSEIISFLSDEKKKEEKKKKIEAEIEKEKERQEKSSHRLEKAKEVKSSSSCFVVTATMNDPNHPIVNDYRLFRDRYLLNNKAGLNFIKFYYLVGPYFARLINNSEILRKIIFKSFIKPIHKLIQKKFDTNHH